MLMQIFKWHLQKALLPLKQLLKRCFPKLVHIKTSASDNKRYTNICISAYKSDSVFQTFKKHKNYTNIVETVTRDQGQAYLDIIKKEGKDLLKYSSKFKENDKCGSPVVFNYDIGNFSPTTLRYIKVLTDLKNMFGNLNDLDIVEIGGGYGGQCKIIYDVFKFKSYTIIDLETVLPLIQKYLTKLEVKNFICLKPDEIHGQQNYDLIISNYAFSECEKKVQDEYINKIIKKTQKGYITYNYHSKSKENKYKLVEPYSRQKITQILHENHHLNILDERPKTGPVNFIITWNDTCLRPAKEK